MEHHVIGGVLFLTHNPLLGGRRHTKSTDRCHITEIRQVTLYSSFKYFFLTYVYSYSYYYTDKYMTQSCLMSKKSVLYILHVLREQLQYIPKEKYIFDLKGSTNNNLML